MNCNNFLLALLLLLFIACKPDDDGMRLPSEPGIIAEYMVDDPRCDSQLGQALITHSTRDLIPYSDGEELIFIDSLGNTIRFMISVDVASRRDVITESFRISGGQTDTIYRCSGFEQVWYNIRSEDIGVYFLGILTAGELLFQFEEDELPDDGITLLMGYEESESAHLAFRQNFSRESTSLTSSVLSNPSVTIFDRTFPNVNWISEQQQLRGQPRYLRYSFDLGIVFFRDGAGKMWRLENR